MAPQSCKKNKYLMGFDLRSKKRKSVAKHRLRHLISGCCHIMNSFNEKKKQDTIKDLIKKMSLCKCANCKIVSPTISSKGFENLFFHHMGKKKRYKVDDIIYNKLSGIIFKNNFPKKLAKSIHVNNKKDQLQNKK